MAEFHTWVEEPLILLIQPYFTLINAEKICDYLLALMILIEANGWRQLL
jgi:hypothetical protein